MAVTDRQTQTVYMMLGRAGPLINAVPVAYDIPKHCLVCVPALAVPRLTW